jgi:hypothetical protein
MTKTKSKADPIFAAIEKHKAACAAYEKTRKVYGNMLPNDPRYKASRAADRKAAAQERKTLVVLLGCRPTTLVGAVAALEHVARPEWLAKGVNYTKETVLSAITGYEEDAVGEDLINLAKSFPLRLAASLIDIIGPEAEAR